jgi:hypothetical protein
VKIQPTTPKNPTTQQTHPHKPISISFLISSFLAGEIGAPPEISARSSESPPQAEIGSSTPGRDQSFNRGERRGGWRKGEKREGKKGRERADRGNERRKKIGPDTIFYSMKSYSSFSFVKSYCRYLAI